MGRLLVAFLLFIVTLPSISEGLRVEPTGQTISPYVEVRQCGFPAREADGTIKRDPKVLAVFKQLYPCPSTGKTAGACPGWALDHVVPLAVCGCDAIRNLQWLPNTIKSASGVDAKDRWERKVYSCASAVPASAVPASAVPASAVPATPPASVPNN